MLLSSSMFLVQRSLAGTYKRVSVITCQDLRSRKDQDQSSIMLLFEHNFGHNGVVLGVTPKSILLKFSSIMYLTLHWPEKVLTLIQTLAFICH